MTFRCGKVWRSWALAVGLGLSGAGAAAPAVDAAWQKWSDLVNTHPCEWLDAAAVSTIVGTPVTAARSESRSEAVCRWSDAGGVLRLSAAVLSRSTADEVNVERQAQEQQIAQYGTGRFEAVHAGQEVHAILRKDRMRVSVFFHRRDEAAYVALTAYPGSRRAPLSVAQQRKSLDDLLKALLTRYFP
jgi:hypothetical protein